MMKTNGTMKVFLWQNTQSSIDCIAELKLNFEITVQHKRSMLVPRSGDLSLLEESAVFHSREYSYLTCIDAVLTLIIKSLFLFGDDKLQKVLPCFSFLYGWNFYEETETTYFQKRKRLLVGYDLVYVE